MTAVMTRGSGQTSRALLVACAVTLCAAVRVSAATLAVSLHQRDGQPLPGAVVTVESLGKPLPAAQPVVAIMDQVDLAFVPDVLIVPVNSSVHFPNSDAVSHQVYSFSSARRFQLPLYRGKPYPPVKFDQPGIITLGCNIHDQMLAYIFVTDAPLFARTDARGEHHFATLAPGRYRLRIWHPLLDEPQEVVRTVEVEGERDSVMISLTLSRKLRPAPLSDRPHSWDY